MAITLRRSRQSNIPNIFTTAAFPTMLTRQTNKSATHTQNSVSLDREQGQSLTLSQYSMKSFSADHSASCVALCVSSWPQMLGHSAAQDSRKARIPKILTAVSRRWSQSRLRQRVQTFGGGVCGLDRMVGRSGRGVCCAAGCVVRACASWPVRAASTWTGASAIPLGLDGVSPWSWDVLV